MSVIYHPHPWMKELHPWMKVSSLDAIHGWRNVIHGWKCHPWMTSTDDILPSMDVIYPSMDGIFSCQVFGKNYLHHTLNEFVSNCLWALYLQRSYKNYVVFCDSFPRLLLAWCKKFLPKTWLLKIPSMDGEISLIELKSNSMILMELVQWPR